jgi:hypothetical protein
MTPARAANRGKRLWHGEAWGRVDRVLVRARFLRALVACGERPEDDFRRYRIDTRVR